MSWQSLLLSGRRGLAASAGVVAASAVLAPMVAFGDSRRTDPAATDPPAPPVGSVHRVSVDDGAAIHAVVVGGRHAGPTFVLTHGLCCDHRLWAYQARVLGEVGRVVTWDLRGHGASQLPSGASGFDAARLAADLAAVVNAFATGPVFLVGHSLGGMVSLLALRDDERLRRRVSGAVLVSTPPTDVVAAALCRTRATAAEKASLRALCGWLAGDSLIDRLLLSGREPGQRSYAVVRAGGFGARPCPGHVRAIRDQIAATPPAVRRATLGAMFGVDLRGTLADIDLPMLFIAGGRDRLVKAQETVGLAEELPRSRAVVFRGAGHAVVLERHAAITRRIGVLAEQVLSGDSDLDVVAAGRPA
jgi:pimeloyl-ACP methyl ester carboxylesterase